MDQKNYDYALIGNCSSAALISSDCSIDWLCLPFFDSSSVFARLLDKDKGGFFQIEGVNTVSSSQTYLHDTGIVRTSFITTEGEFEVMDYMPRYRTREGGYYCPSEIHRFIKVVAGKPRMKVVFDPRPNYAAGKGACSPRSEYIKITSTKGPYNSFYLYTSLDRDKVVNGEETDLPQESFLVLAYHEKLTQMTLPKVFLDFEKTKTYWLDWVNRTHLPEKHIALAARSAITLKMLMFQKTGAVIAAPTTSLPEIIGKDRNWDYRFCWIRDASMIIDLYARLGHVHSSAGYIHFILNRMLRKYDEISVMYGINGESILEEKELEHLAGYENSRPVRIGNDAYRQTQNDIYGELIETIYTYFLINGHSQELINEEIWTLVRSLVNLAAAVWESPDAGIWERRNELQHYVHSKMMNWVAFDRAAKIARFLGRTDYAEYCEALAIRVREDILTNGWNDSVKAFTMYYGSNNTDASNLLMLHYGFLSPSDDRMKSTVYKCYEELGRNGYVMRYVCDDDFGTPQNAFIVCSFWMINALFLIGETTKASSLFEKVIQKANKHGLFSEDIDTATGRLTGNFPQGYSHLAFIQSLLLLETNYNWSDFQTPSSNGI
jgi:GH15 family glucan-1,4-alpha-glucosidase